MPQLSSKAATIYAVLVFVFTLVVSFLLPGYTITLSGLLIVIFLSVFVQDQRSTIIAGVVSSIVIGLHLWMAFSQGAYQPWTEFFFMLLLAFFTTLIVLYIKGLIRNMQFDKSHMTSLFENATEGILLTNEKGTIILANPAACKMFGYEGSELIGLMVDALIPKRYRAGHVHLREGFYHHPQNREMGSGRDLYGERKDGHNFPVEVSLSVYRQQAQTFVIAFVVDITHRKEIEGSMIQQQQQLEKVSHQLRKLNAELEAKVEERTIILKEALQRLEESQAELSEALDKERQLNEIKSRFVSMASHEFRTPLSAVLSSASLIAKYTTTEQQDRRDKHINRIKDSVKHLNDLLEDFLSLGKLDEGKIGASPSPFNLAETIRDTIDDMKGILKQSQQISYEHEGPELVYSDKKLLKNIMINLISNAAKFSPEDGAIRVKSRTEGEQATVSVQDQGIGISEEDQEHLFSSFFRGKNALNIQGTGLGLHIVKRYLELIDGNIKLHSRLGEGTTFTFSLPVNPKNNAENYPGN
ncbi:PAS domain-containing sensor histidine kinase [Paraflavisolibacter sp. H34]|uniref:sensor histidine kinase n=1 Tax=Huijunlia imazamoxiresistens TaxID=3127457 RepID=UPI003019BBE7